MHSMAKPSGKPEGMGAQVLQFAEDNFLGQRLAEIIFQEWQLENKQHICLLSSTTSKNVIQTSASGKME